MTFKKYSIISANLRLKNNNDYFMKEGG